MAFKYPERKQRQLFPDSIEEYVEEDSPVRAYDAVVDMMDLEELGIATNEHGVGNSRYDPRSMLKLYTYGYSYGLRSCRKLERAVHNDLTFIWLMGGLKPGYKSISEFRRNNRTPIAKALKQVARMCLKMGLIAGNTLFFDGTKVRANASIANTWTEERCRKELESIDKRIEEILQEGEQADLEEEGQESEVHMGQDLKEQHKLRSKVKELWQELQSEEKTAINSTDRDARQMYSKDGSHASYNVQTAVDDKHGLIVSAEALSAPNDRGQLSGQVEKASATLGKRPETACADAGYADTDDMDEIDKDINIIVPSQKQAQKKKPGPFDHQNFSYIREENCYICPEGAKLYPIKRQNKKPHKTYRVECPETCKKCKNYGVCTTAKRGREINRLVKADLKEELEANYSSPENQEIFSRRKSKAELPFGHIKYNLGVKHFLVRGYDKVQAEVSLLACCFNIRRMISLLGGVPELISALSMI